MNTGNLIPNKPRSRFSLLTSLCLGILSTVLTAIPALSAERITFFYPPFGQFSISIKDLETFAKEGRITRDFAFYAKQAKPEQLATLRNLLEQRFEISPVTVAQFTYTPLGETTLKRIGLVFKTATHQNSFYALRAAFILAAADPEGLTVVNMLRKFPLNTIELDLPLSLRLVRDLSQLFQKRDLAIAAVQQLAAAAPAVSTLSDLRQPGPMNWRKETLTFTNPNRNRSFPADIYLPQGISATAPLIVISHGLASDRDTFAYLAQHLASYGFAVAVPEHPGTNSTEIEQFLSGFDRPPSPTEWVNRPLDVKYMLDGLEQKSQSDPAWKGKIDVQQVGVLGQSWGGYTVLALAGAKLDFANIHRDCNPDSPRQPFNLAALLECRAADLPPAAYDLKDDRVKAVLAINPLDSTVFGRKGLSQIQIPLMMVAGTNDYFAPPFSEQIYPFTWLTTPHKYLVVMANGTHFSTLGGTGRGGALPVPKELVGPDATLAHPSIGALSTAFFKAYLTDRPEYLPYLSQGYVQSLIQSPFSYSLIDSLTAAQLEKAIAPSRGRK